jgi:hypothetical protein
MGLLGLDLASRRTGWCVGDGSGLPTCGAWAFPPVKAEDGSYDFGLLLSTLDEYLTNCHARHGFEAVAYEAPILVFQRRDESGAVVRNDNLSTLRLLYPLGAFVEYWCHRRGIECFEVSVQAIKKELGGHRNAGRPTSCSSLRRSACSCRPAPGAKTPPTPSGHGYACSAPFNPRARPIGTGASTAPEEPCCERDQSLRVAAELAR